ncbi:glycosyltransferase family 2 protein [Candidatus Saccharibacteria bacterium]|nr:glycosyltransferase family 2 protein [Candidatus Saccharibacteria bacterium]
MSKSQFPYELPYNEEKSWRYRVFEILPGFLSWTALALPFILAFVNINLAALLMIAYLMLWFVKAVALNVRALQGWRLYEEHLEVDWEELLDDVRKHDEKKKWPKWHLSNLKRIERTPNGIKPDDIVHAVIVATWNEAREVLQPTLENIKNSTADPKKMIVLLAYEQRGGEAVEKQAVKLMKEYEGVFMISKAVKHIDAPGEVIGKGPNITYAGRELQRIVEAKGIDPLHVLVTTLDADNRPHAKYFSCLSYVYAMCHDPIYLSFQPIPMFTNNIWDAPAPMRVIATGNSYWMLIQGLRQHMLRNFSAHAQSLAALIKTDFWSKRTIVEDGHQFWRSYFAFEGKHEVIPIFLPIYQDAVLAVGYRRTLKAQFVQLRRWAWGASDIAYVAKYGFFTKHKIPKHDVWFKFLRLVEGHFSWATAPLILAFGALIPWAFHQKDFIANQLPQVASRIQTVAMLGILVTLYLSFKILPPKPLRYKRHRTFLMVAQWGLLPVTTIVYSAFAALYSQTRLMFGWYYGKFDVTEKAVKTDTGTVTSHAEEVIALGEQEG